MTEGTACRLSPLPGSIHSGEYIPYSVKGCGARLGLCCRGGVRVHMCWDGQGPCRSGQNELGWVGIGDSLTGIQFTHEMARFVEDGEVKLREDQEPASLSAIQLLVTTVLPGHGNRSLESEIGLNLQVGSSVTRPQTVLERSDLGSHSCDSS